MTSSVQTHPLISIRGSATVQEAARLMADASIGAVGVLGVDKDFAGIVTERDLAWFVARARDPRRVKVGEIVNDFPVVVDGPIDDVAAVERMRAARVRHLLVRDGEDFRIVSMRDYLAAGRSAETELTARDVMTAPAIACRDEAYFEEVAELLAERDISGMPVLDATGALVGVISERDLAHALGGPMVRLALRRHHHEPFTRDLREIPRGARRAKDVMTSPALYVELDTPLEEVAGLMRLHQVSRVPVTDAGHLVGIVTSGDVLGAVAGVEHAEIDLTHPPIVVGGTGIDHGTGARRERLTVTT